MRTRRYTEDGQLPAGAEINTNVSWSTVFQSKTEPAQLHDIYAFSNTMESELSYESRTTTMIKLLNRVEKVFHCFVQTRDVGA